MGQAGMGWIIQGWGGSYRGRVGHTRVGLVTKGWGGSCRGEVGHARVGWVMQGTMRRSNNTLLEPGIKTLPDLSLKLYWDSSMWQVNWLICSGRNGMFKVITET